MMKRIMIDTEKCDGCLNCTFACMNANRKQQGTVYDLKVTDQENPARNRIEKIGSTYFPVFCRHCDEPDCVGVCMSGALKKNPDTGLVEYDEKQCCGCYMCVMACRYGHPRQSADRKIVVRCSFCQDTQEKEPQCVRSCPKAAINMGEVEHS